MKAIVSCSGGKDSTATLLLALERLPKSDILPVFADTGNEHQAVFDYLAYLEEKTGLRIKRLKSDFTRQWWKKRDYVRDNWQRKLEAGNPGKWRLRGPRDENTPPMPEAPTDMTRNQAIGVWAWLPPTPPMTPDAASDVVRSALGVLDAGPTGNQFLDLCVVKGRFPSRMAQFCTQELKRYPLDMYAVEIVEANPGEVIESWQGVRANESASRAKLKEREAADLWTIYRPILSWTIDNVFAIHRKHGVKPNPLYKQGMGRVGCMPCINVSKDELLEISRRFPEHIKKIAEWERIVGETSKRGASFIFDEERGGPPLGIADKIEWAKTTHGGVQFDLLRYLPAEWCASSYGLCDVDESQDGISV